MTESGLQQLSWPCTAAMQCCVRYAQAARIVCGQYVHLKQDCWTLTQLLQVAQHLWHLVNSSGTVATAARPLPRLKQLLLDVYRQAAAVAVPSYIRLLQCIRKCGLSMPYCGTKPYDQCHIGGSFFVAYCPADPLKQHQPGPGQYQQVPAAVTHPAPPAVSISHRLPGSREAERRPAPGG
jgi:hypothetical protein